ncbi:hypothetical protein ACWC9T_14105 [Kitasatospora sp. NPDC001159]
MSKLVRSRGQAASISAAWEARRLLWVVPRTSHISAEIHHGNPYHAVGDYPFSGGAVLLAHPDRQVEVLVQHQVENLCETLA